MINERHVEFGNLLKWFASQKLFVSIDLIGDGENRVAYFFETEEDRNLGNYRFLIASEVYALGLRVAGDITEMGYLSKEISAKEVVEMYRKWVYEGKPHKENTHSGFDIETELMISYKDEMKPVFVGFDEE